MYGSDAVISRNNDYELIGYYEDVIAVNVLNQNEITIELIPYIYYSAISESDINNYLENELAIVFLDENLDEIDTIYIEYEYSEIQSSFNLPSGLEKSYANMDPNIYLNEWETDDDSEITFKITADILKSYDDGNSFDDLSQDYKNNFKDGIYSNYEYMYSYNSYALNELETQSISIDQDIFSIVIIHILLQVIMMSNKLKLI